jgi:hypothetical protein
MRNTTGIIPTGVAFPVAFKRARGAWLTLTLMISSPGGMTPLHPWRGLMRFSASLSFGMQTFRAAPGRVER